MRLRFLAVTAIWLSAAASADAAPAVDAARAVRDAERRLALGDTLGAIRHLEHSHLDDHRDPAAYVLLGRLWRERGTIETRLRSQRVLEDARARWGSDTTVLMELGRTYFAQGFYRDSLSCFQSVLDADPGNCAARYMTGLYYYRNWQRMHQYGDDLAAARRHLRAALDCDPDHLEAAVTYLYACFAYGDTSSAECDRQLARHPDAFELRMYRGVLDFDRGRYEEAAARFQRALEVASIDDRAAFASLEPVLPVTDLTFYDDARPGAREELERGYWLGADPDPTTPLNQRALEHFRRMFVADVLYAHPAGARRGWQTDRGEVFVKFGTPLTVDYTLGDELFSGAIEIWSYVLGGVFHQFMFVDEFLNGNPRIPYDVDPLLSFIRHSPRLSEVHDGAVPLPISVDVTAFRDDNLSSSIYVAMHVDADSLRASVDPAPDRLVARCACFDAGWNRETTASDTTHFSPDDGRVVGSRRVVGRVCTMRVPFDRYHVAAALEDAGAVARATARADADAARFVRDDLALSDILLHEGPDAGASDADAIVRRGTPMRPRVSHRYSDGERVHAYLEAYNLNVVAGEAAYEVRYAIYPARDDDAPSWLDWGRRAARLFGIAEGEPAVSQSFRRTGFAHDDHERLSIDVDALRPGRYRLVVEITDLHGGNRAVSHTPLVREVPTVAEDR